jgi:TolA-binding protein
MNTNVFVVYILVLTLGVSHFYAEVREFYTPVKEYKQKISHLNKKVKQERFKHMLTTYEFADFRAHVATLLPNAIQESGPGEKSYPLRTLASVTQKTVNENLAVQRAKNLFDEGKRFFRDNKFTDAVRALTLLVNKHTYSVHIPEAMFLLVESHYLLNEFDDSVYFANKMIDLFPENELTGYAMVRLGKIYVNKERYEEAIDIFQTVLKSFPQRDVANVARQSLRAVEL